MSILPSENIQMILNPPETLKISSTPGGPSLYASSLGAKSKLIEAIKRSPKLKAMAAERANEIEKMEQYKLGRTPSIVVIDGDIAQRENIVRIIEDSLPDTVVIAVSSPKELRGLNYSSLFIDDWMGNVDSKIFDGLATTTTATDRPGDWSLPATNVLKDLQNMKDMMNDLVLQSSHVKMPAYVLSPAMASRYHDELQLSPHKITILPEQFNVIKTAVERSEYTEPHWIKGHGRNNAPNTSKHNKRASRCK